MICPDNPAPNVARRTALSRCSRTERGPDIVLYLNGIAIGLIELKRSSVEIADGMRQLVTNQEEIFNEWFFATAQILFAGSDSQGLRYATTTSPEEYFVEWKYKGAD